MGKEPELDIPTVVRSAFSKLEGAPKNVESHKR